uniref:Uncharacterized protein n=1 Tax=Anguilla anguilla TaxID=7936 RepID=A0A0E9TFJ3_ANGAN
MDLSTFPFHSSRRSEGLSITQHPEGQQRPVKINWVGAHPPKPPVFIIMVRAKTPSCDSG